MSTEAERAYVRSWVETGRLLEDLRWHELRSLDDTAARVASDRLLQAASLVPVPVQRQHWSGLVDLQALLHARRKR